MVKSKKDGSQRKGGVLRHFEPNQDFKTERKDKGDLMFKDIN